MLASDIVELSPLLWALHAGALFSALGTKVRTVTCGDTLGRTTGGTSCNQYGPRLAELFERQGHYGVVIRGVLEIMALIAKLPYDEGGMVLS